MRVFALTQRILRQIVRDKRTMGLLIVAPILVLTMLHMVFNGGDYTPKIGFVDVPYAVMEQMDLGGADVTTYSDEKSAKADLAEQTIDGYLTLKNNEPTVVLEGSDPSVAGATMKWLHQAMPTGQENANNPQLEIDYLHGSSDMGTFDYFGPVLLGFFV